VRERKTNVKIKAHTKEEDIPNGGRKLQEDWHVI